MGVRTQFRFEVCGRTSQGIRKSGNRTTPLHLIVNCGRTFYKPIGWAVIHTQAINW